MLATSCRRWRPTATRGRRHADSAPSTAGTAVLRDTRNKAPAFKDSKDNTITMAARSVAETAMGVTSDNDDTADDAAADNVGGTIMVQDPNIATGAESDSLAFSLSGADASNFRIRGPAASETGATRNVQIEVKGDPKFDYETKDTYMVTLTARDDYGETADLELTIMITDVNEAPVVTLGASTNQPPMFPGGHSDAEHSGGHAGRPGHRSPRRSQRPRHGQPDLHPGRHGCCLILHQRRNRTAAHQGRAGPCHQEHLHGDNRGRGSERLVRYH